MGAHRDVAYANTAAVVLSVVSLACWARACTQMHPPGPADLGLWASAVPTFWIALLASVSGFVVAVRARRLRWYVVLGTLVSLLAVLSATPAVIGGGAAGAEASSTVLRILSGAPRAPESLLMARWAPLAVAIALLAPVLLVARAITPQPRAQWLTVGIFVTLDRTGSDHRSSQSLSFWLALCASAVVLTVIRRGDDPGDQEPSTRLVPRHDTGAGADPVVAGGRRVRLSRAQWATVHVLVGTAVLAAVLIDPLVGLLLVLTLLGLWLVGRGPHRWVWGAAAGTLLGARERRLRVVAVLVAAPLLIALFPPYGEGTLGRTFQLGLAPVALLVALLLLGLTRAGAWRGVVLVGVILAMAVLGLLSGPPTGCRTSTAESSAADVRQAVPVAAVPHPPGGAAAEPTGSGGAR